MYIATDYRPQNGTVLIELLPKEGVLLGSKQTHDFEHYKVIAVPDCNCLEVTNFSAGDIIVAHTSVVKDFVNKVCQYVNLTDIFAVVKGEQEIIEGEHY